MRLTLLPLEPRDCPSAYDLGGGVLHLSAGHEYRVFADYSGPLTWLTNANGVTTVAPAPDHGGGPRVATLDPDGSRVQPDYFAANPASRAGVVLVDTGGTITREPLSIAPDLFADDGDAGHS